MYFFIFASCVPLRPTFVFQITLDLGKDLFKGLRTHKPKMIIQTHPPFTRLMANPIPPPKKNIISYYVIVRGKGTQTKLEHVLYIISKLSTLYFFIFYFFKNYISILEQIKKLKMALEIK